jgi:hypothetical protein
MTADHLLRLIAAPELVVVDLVSSALSGLRLALLAEHPLLDDDSAAPDDPPVRRRARTLLRHAERLRRALRAYRREALSQGAPVLMRGILDLSLREPSTAFLSCAFSCSNFANRLARSATMSCRT